ncbi:hypothetical protein [Sphingobium sp. DC-2]|uniref:hypothetical protein n=1 Tax=Sphingobium sp. DC-2 TaxID=1303256 RepID=UPI000A55BA68|nr:hypothetical protein [Sphingobium sp. DC-2]
MSTIRSDLADHATPLIRNAWYVAGLSDELDGGLMDRWILGQPVRRWRWTIAVRIAPSRFRRGSASVIRSLAAITA